MGQDFEIFLKDLRSKIQFLQVIHVFFFESARESSVLFLAIEHCSIKNLLNISVKSKRNLSWRNKVEIQGTFFLFLRVFNMII